MIGRLLLHSSSPSSAMTTARRIASSTSSSNARRLVGATTGSSRVSRLSIPPLPGRVVFNNQATTTNTAAANARRSFGDKKSEVPPPGGGGGDDGGWWNSAAFWGRCGAIAGWGMSGAAIYDALQSSPELISLNMTGVLLVYSSLFVRWALIVKPQNLLLAGCHVANVCAQGNQLRRAVEYKRDMGMDDEVRDVQMKAGMTMLGGLACVLGGPTLQGMIVNANIGPISTIAAAEAGPFTVHFWAPMSKWMISGASFLELDRPTEKISIAQYTALTLTGFFFTRYALLVTPINYTLCSVNIALFGSSAWHLGRKIKADYL